MSYSIRNSIILGVVLVIILGIGIFMTMISMPKKLRVIENEIKAIEQDFQNTPDLANQYNTLSAQLEAMKKRWETRDKEIPPKDITGEMYGYLNRMIDVSGEVKMDMTYVSQADMGRYGYNTYSLKGEAYFDNLYRFVWYIENGRRVLKIANLTLRGYEAKEKTGETKILVLYEMDIFAYYSLIPELNNAPGKRTLSPTVLTSKPFYPLIFHEIPAPLANEIEIERSDLKAVIPGKAFIIDQNQKSRVLEEGDKVYLGYVTKILPDEGKLRCLLNKGGVAETFELTIRVGQPIK